MKWTEDGSAMATGGGLLAIALTVFLGLPLLGSELLGPSATLTWLSEGFSTWQNHPFGAVSALGWLGLGFVFWLILGLGCRAVGTSFAAFGKGFVLVFALAVLAKLLGAQADFKAAGIGYALWAIALGLAVRNILGLKSWVFPALRHEYFIKTGLILLGAEVLFGKILAIGLPGLFVAWLVTPIVLVTTYWFGQRILRIKSKTLNMTISADMSVCGVSAAIATAAACGAKKEELTTAVGLSMLFTSVMMVVMPLMIKSLGFPEVLGGAWIGGTIDATGAVVAAGAFLGEKALNVAATIKMIQNILIGVIAFGVAVYWTTQVEKQNNKTVGISEIWIRFPKFVLGFIGVSIFFSLLHHRLEPALASQFIEQDLYGFSKSLRNWLFCLAFVSIGLATDFRELRSQFSGGKPLLLYLCGQLFNLALTLLMAWLMFYVIFDQITESI